MTALLQLSPSDLYVAWTVSVLVQSTAVLVIAWVLASLLGRRNAAAKYATWLAALALLALSPLTGYLAVSSKVSLVELSLLQGPLDQPTVSPQAVAPSMSESPGRSIAKPSGDFHIQPQFDDEVLTLSPRSPKFEATPTFAVPVSQTPSVAPTSAPWSLANCVRVGVLIVWVFWVCGIGYLVLRFGLRARRLSLQLRKTRPVEDPKMGRLMQDICHDLGLNRIPELRMWAAPDANLAPITVGVVATFGQASTRGAARWHISRGYWYAAIGRRIRDRHDA